jgi:peptide deformylase
MAILPLYTTPHPILRKKGIKVELVDDAIRTIVNDMIETMYHDNGIGLAAPQVGISKRILVMDLDDNDDDKSRPKGFFPLCVINPEIISKSTEVCMQKEGCLSVPEQYIEVTRPAEITLKFLDKNGKEQILECKGLMSRCMQHEMDHLDGKLTIDYLSPLKRDTALRKIAKLKRDKM